VAPKGHKLSAESKAKITGRPISSDSPFAVHYWLKTRHPKVGRCEKCGREGRTDYAYLYHPEPHTRDRDDYRELCRRCHFKMDEDIYKRGASLNASLSTKQRSEAVRRGAQARWGRSPV